MRRTIGECLESVDCQVNNRLCWLRWRSGSLSSLSLLSVILQSLVDVLWCHSIPIHGTNARLTFGTKGIGQNIMAILVMCEHCNS